MMTRNFFQEESVSVGPDDLNGLEEASIALPASFGQQRLWFTQQLNPENFSYNIPNVAQVKAPLDIEILRQSLCEIVQRHEILRTSFSLVEGQLMQIIAPSLDIPLSIIDLRACTEIERAEKIKQIEREAIQHPFDLTQGPLFRTTLFHLQEQEYLFLFVVHHIIFDGWSLGVFEQELSMLYTAFSQGQPSPLPALPIQYADFAGWQREKLNAKVLAEHLAYWERQLDAASPELGLPTDYLYTAAQPLLGATQTIVLPLGLQEELKAVCRREGVTLFMALLTAFQILLYQYARQDDILIGTPLTIRERAEVQSLIGFFINTLVLRTNLAGNPTLRQLLNRVRETCLGAYAHQDIPFEKLVEHLQPEQSFRQMPFFRVVFVLQNGVPSLSASVDPILNFRLLENGTAKCDLHLAVTEKPEGLQTTIEYRTDLFEGTTIRRMLHHFEIICNDIIHHPEQRLSEFSLLTSAERHRILIEWNQTRREYIQPAPLSRLFEQQVERTPDAVALVNAQQQWTYQQVNSVANQLAHHLHRLGVGSEMPVGVACGRSPALLISLLAILKAGGVYLPLDPDYPRARLAFLLEDAQVTLLLAQREGDVRSPVEHIRLLCLDELWPTLSQQSEENLDLDLVPEQAAYIIYTSGSTGIPKGVLVSHYGLANVLHAQMATFNVGPGSRVLLCASPSFDASIFEIIMALLTGATLCLGGVESVQAGPFLAQQLQEQAITTMTLTPSVLATVPHQELASLSTLIVAGEVCPPALASRWAVGRAFFNAYGPTETTIWASVARCQAESSRVTIGQPISNTQIYVLDEHMEPVVQGVVGEVYIGGIGLSRGYLRRPALTAERFVPHPFSEQEGMRLYRTGDYARYSFDGMLEYVGRYDRQVKIHGIRVELAEIEQALVQHPAVQNVLILAKEHAQNGKLLVSYVIPQNGWEPDGNELREFLSASVPDHMLPSAFVFLQTFPLTLNGKLDYQALPPPETARPAQDREVIAPRNEVEIALTEIWKEVLDIEQVSIHDGFFDLGGDSMLSIRILALAEEKGLEISLPQIFQNTTISKLAQEIKSKGSNVTSSIAAPGRAFHLLCEKDYQKLPADLEDAYPLTMLQIGMLFHSEYTPAAPMYHNISYGQIQAPYNILKLRSAVKQLVLRHPVLRTSFDLSTFTEPLQLVHRNASVPIRVDDLRHLSSSEQERVLEDWIAAERNRRFEWTQAPLLRLQVHRLNEAVFRLTITEHHSILDGWSVASLFTELVRCYVSLVENDMSLDLPSLTSSFGEFVALERETLANEAVRHYWTQKLVGVISIRLPRWTSAPLGSVPEMRNLSVPLSQELSDSLKIVASKLNVPLKSVLLAAHMRVLGLLSGQTDILTGLVTNGRLETADGELVLGLFLNTLPYRQQLTGDSWANLIRATFENEREALPFRRYPLARIQQEQGGGALFEILFNFVHFHVYRNLQKWQLQSFSEENDVGQNNFTLSTEFSLDVLTSRVGLSLVYDLTQISNEQIQAIAAYYVNALTALITEPEANYTTSSLLADHEKLQLLHAWNDTSYDFTPAQSICDVFEASVERLPDAGAVCIEDVQITYQELDERANQLAHYLQQLGVGPEVTVGLCVDSSLELLIGLWGILKAGGAYVPLDPDAPIHRHLTILNDAAVAVLVTQTRFAHLSATLPLAHVYLDSNWAAIAQSPATPPVRMGNAHNAAYILYTSGSTGQPKGVVVEHRQLLNYTHSIIQRLAFASVSHFALLHPLSVDFGVTTLFAALCTGGRLAVLPRTYVTDPQSLASFLECQGIECLKLTPSHLSALQATLPNGCLLPQRLLILGGERCSTAWVESLRPPASECAILNHYGPTETTVGVLTHLVPAAQSALPTAMVPLGRPLANTRIYLLDPSLQPVPVGVPGELYIGGANVTRGYLGRADLTAESYLPDPFSGEPGGRLYKTGDRACYQLDGLIEFLGRVDEQVKIRGYRVEPAEVAHVLRQHATVRDAIVLAHAEDGLDERLIAYVVTDEATILTSEELSTYLQTQIPEYMMPAAFVFIDKLPLLAHGKVDRQRLAALASAQAREKEKNSFVAPRTPIEARLVEIWAEIFKVEQVGINDDFFELGGHSLLAMQIISRVRLAFQIDLPIRFLFEIRTIANLALAIEQVLYMENEGDAM